MKQTFTTSDGIRLAYCIDDYTDPWKSAPTLLMLHSAMSSAKRFYSMVPGHERFIGHWTDTWFMDEISKIQCPTLIVEPGAHPIGAGSAFAEMEKRIPDAERVVYENGRHNVFDYLPERCVADALAFMQAFSGGSEPARPFGRLSEGT